MIKVRLKANWTSVESITNRVITQFKTSDSDLDGIEFVLDDSYDIAVYCNHVSDNFKPGAMNYVFPHEPSWSGTHQKATCFENFTLFGFDKSLYTCPENVIECLAHTFYGGRGDWVDSLNDWCYESAMKYNTAEKTKNISSIVTTLNQDIGGTCLYPKRYSLLKSITDDLNFIDYYGWHGDKENIKSEPRKILATLPYRFQLSIENEHQNNWVTEKFYDPIICNTIPIYYGCKNIKEIYPEDGYILLESLDIDYVRDVLNNVNKNSEEIYLEKLPGLIEIKKRYFEEYNLLKKIKKIAYGDTK